MSAPQSNGSGSMGGAIRIFHVLGINVYLHWTWGVVAIFLIRSRVGEYGSPIWNVAEYLTLFAIVLLHEFGHALACRSVGGRADRILLWPLGGIAYVSPPRRPGAVLWSIAAGPLVNVALLPLTIGAWVVASVMLPETADLVRYFYVVAIINFGLLVFNMLPIYPLDGGQIVQALLWFLIGPVRSLSIAATIGLFGAGGLVLLALTWGEGDIFLIIIALFAGSRSLIGLQQAKIQGRALKLPRHGGWHCPACGEAPPIGEFWRCSCGGDFDPFASQGQCPRCSAGHGVAGCPFCGAVSTFSTWLGVAASTG